MGGLTATATCFETTLNSSLMGLENTIARHYLDKPSLVPSQ